MEAARRVLIVKDLRGEREVPLAGRVTVGRDPECEISAADPSMSRRHAEVVESPSGVVVRDLESRNGIKVNNLVVKEAVLHAGDVVQVASVRLRLVEREAEPPPVVSPPVQDPRARVRDDRTAPIVVPAARVGAPEPGLSAPLEQTAEPSPSAVPHDLRDVGVRVEPPDAAAPEQPHRVEPASSPASPSTARYDLRRIVSRCAILALAAAIPLTVWHERQLDALAEARATTIVNWLATDASVALTNGQDATIATQAVFGEPGVAAARVLQPDGRVIAPTAQAGERIERIPGLGVAPSDVRGLRSGWNGDHIEAARPVGGRSGPRTALAWVTIRRGTVSWTSRATVVVLVFLTSLLVALAARSLTRNAPSSSR